MTLPQIDALNRHWSAVPPAAVQLKRLALALGLPDTRSPPRSRAVERPHDALQEALAAGMPVMEGRPDDPMLAFLDL